MITTAATIAFYAWFCVPTVVVASVAYCVLVLNPPDLTHPDDRAN